MNTWEFISLSFIGGAISICFTLIQTRLKKEKKTITTGIPGKTDRCINNLKKTGEEIDEIVAALNSLKMDNKKLKEEADAAKNILSMSKEKVETFNRSLEIQLKKEEKRNFWQNIIQNFIFCVLGAILGTVLGVVVGRTGILNKGVKWIV